MAISRMLMLYMMLAVACSIPADPIDSKPMTTTSPEDGEDVLKEMEQDEESAMNALHKAYTALERAKQNTAAAAQKETADAPDREKRRASSDGTIIIVTESGDVIIIKT